MTRTTALSEASSVYKMALAAANVTFTSSLGAAQVTSAKAQDLAQYTWAVANAYAKPLADIAAVQTALAADQDRPTDYFKAISATVVAQVGERGWAIDIVRLGDYFSNGGFSKLLLSDDFTNRLNNIDAFFAGWGNAFTLTLTTRLRKAMWGDAATQNHSGFWYDLGNVVGTAHMLVLGFGNPCTLVNFGNALRGLNGLQAIGGVLNAADNIGKENYFGAALDLLGVLGNVASIFRACFVAGTPMKLADGNSKPIEEIRGFDKYGNECDVVLARDEHNPTAPLVSKRVLQTFIRTSPVLNVHVFGRIIGTTREHPFYVEQKGWLTASELQLGDRFQSSDGRWNLCEGVSDSGEVTTVYNFEVEDAHTYFVGGADWGFDVWAHNASYSSLPSRFGRENHHIGQNAALREVIGYSKSTAPAVSLRGGSRALGSPHYLANLAQIAANTTLRATGSSTQSILQVVRTARQALEAAGVARPDRRVLLKELVDYLKTIPGLTGRTLVRIPG